MKRNILLVLCLIPALTHYIFATESDITKNTRLDATQDSFTVMGLVQELEPRGQEPQDTLFLFDFDGTLAKLEHSPDKKREARCQRLVNYFNELKYQFPGKVFIYSAGYAFSTNAPHIGIDPDNDPHYDPILLKENLNWKNFDNKSFYCLPSCKDESLIDLFYYKGLGFFAPSHHADPTQDGSLKADRLQHILDIVGPEIKRVVFVDDLFPYIHPMMVYHKEGRYPTLKSLYAILFEMLN